MYIVFLPAYNEQAALPKLVAKFDAEFKKMGLLYKIVVLDDGSRDQTAAVAEELKKKYPLELLKHEVNRGLGQTIIDGMKYVAQIASEDDLIISMDCDDTHDPQYMKDAFKKISEGYDVVILSRYQKGGGEEGLSKFRSVLSRGAGTFLKLFFPIKGVYEYSCGYRVYRASALKKAWKVFGDDLIRLPHMGFVALPEILIKLRMLGCKIGEVPFRLHYDQKAGRSKMNFGRTITGYGMLVWLYWGRQSPVANND